jgi:hypothetical protein
MNLLSKSLVGCALAAGLAMPAAAVGVHVEIHGSVDYNVIRGDLTGIASGAPVVLGFDVDSTDYVSSSNYPTRGYRIDLASFDMNFGGVHIGLDNPQPYADAYFVLRDNDPAVDGFFMSQGSVDYPLSLSMHVPGLAPEHEFDFSRTFSNSTTLHSLDILDAVGTYGFENMSSYLWTIGRFGNPGAEVVYESISITAVPEPSTLALALLGICALAVMRRRHIG